jgi:hypothetical protein
MSLWARILPRTDAQKSQYTIVVLTSACPSSSCTTRPEPSREIQDRLGVSAARRQRPRHETRETRCSRRSREAPTDPSALARPPSRGRLSALERWSGHPHDPVDARPRRHQADAAVPEHHGRRTSDSDDRSMAKAPSTEVVGEQVRLKPDTTGISAITTIARAIRAQATSDTCASRGSSRPFGCPATASGRSR